MPAKQCDCCKKWKRNNSDFRVCNNKKMIALLRRSKNCELQCGAKVCSTCRSYASRRLQAQSAPSTSSSEVIQSINTISTSSQCSNVTTTEESSIHLSIPRCHNSNACCIICKCKNNLVTVPRAARTKVFVESGILILSGRRCCKNHLKGQVFIDLALESLHPISSDTLITEKDLKCLLDDIRNVAKKKGLDFDTPGQLSASDYYILMGISMNDFNYMYDLVKVKLRSSKTRSSRTCLSFLLVKLRTGLSNTVLSTLFNVKKRLISDAIQSARRALMDNFVPLHLGINHITREKIVKEHTRPLAKYLFSSEDDDDTVILVADGTYIYIQKSSNYSFQRRCFSLHKGRPLVKPMMLVSTTGYIVDVFGPYFADSKNNDASILTHVIKSDAHSIREWLKPNDIMIVDRGFRDCLELLEEMGLVHKMPSFLQKQQQQFSTEEANKTRLVTKVRWVVEAVNGQLKNWKALDNVIPNVQIPFIGDYVRIVCAMLNAFHPTRIKHTEDDEIIAKRMLDLVKQPNHLKQMVENNGWIRKKVAWTELTDSHLPDFPRLTCDELRRLTLGIYQLKQSQSYTQEHLNREGLYSLYIHRDDVSVIRIQIRSRHTSSKMYNIWIKTGQGHNPDIQWYCQCKVGARVVGCCAHVASVLWFLAYWRHCSNDVKKPSLEYSEMLQDAGGGWSSDDTDEESDKE